MDGTRPNAVSLLLEDTIVGIKGLHACLFLTFTANDSGVVHSDLYVCLRACLHLFVKHIASCRPGEVMCGNGQCKPQSSQCVSQSSCADSSEEGTCGE